MLWTLHAKACFLSIGFLKSVKNLEKKKPWRFWEIIKHKNPTIGNADEVIVTVFLSTHYNSVTLYLHLTLPPTTPPPALLYLAFSNFLFDSPLTFLFFISIPLPSLHLSLLSPFSLSLSFMPSSLPLHVGCVICKCSDSCSRSPSFDSAVGVINGSVNCDSSQTR